ncbi:MAG: hypothetical protein GY711_00710 [bacterium]|nr:hypothetical protein [bacterium]
MRTLLQAPLQASLGTACVLSAPILVAWAATADRVAFAPRVGSELERTVKTRMTLELQTVETTVDGEGDHGRPEIGITLAWDRGLVVTDRFDAMRYGAPAKLRRSYDTIEASSSHTLEIGPETEEGESSGSSPLQDSVVLFEWNEEEQEYERTFEADGPSELLPGLVEDVDLRALVPGDEVAEGAEWTVDAAAFLALLLPGGELGLEHEASEHERRPEAVMFGVGPEICVDPAYLVGEPDDASSVKAKYTGAREVDGGRVGVVQVRFEITSTRDAQQTLQAFADELDEAEIDVSVGALELGLNGEAELLWDLEAGRLAGFDWTANATVVVERVAQVAMGAREAELETDLTFTGEISQSITVEVP